MTRKGSQVQVLYGPPREGQVGGPEGPPFLWQKCPRKAPLLPKCYRTLQRASRRAATRSAAAWSSSGTRWEYVSAVMRIEQLGHPRRVNRPAKLVDEEKLAVAIPRRPGGEALLELAPVVGTQGRDRCAVHRDRPGDPRAHSPRGACRRRGGRGSGSRPAAPRSEPHRARCCRRRRACPSCPSLTAVLEVGAIGP